ncbi:MAG: survival protein SurE [Microthrixaceae bacterium]|nr:survival protein SurE [Microthrixaceae bacterium]
MRGRTGRIARVALVLAALGLVAAGCSSDGDGESASSDTTAAEATTTTAATETLDILVSNDDAYDAEGIDAVVEALSALPDTNVVVVAPAENQSGTGGNTTPGALTATEEETLSGHPVTAVQGFPADSVNYGLENVVEEPPDLVVTGLNEGQNMGPVIDASGTVGAARAAVAAGIPALASSQGIDQEPPEFEAGVEQVVAWVEEHRDALVAGEADVVVTNLNIPSCAEGEVRGLVEVPAATDMGGRDYNAADCTSTEEDPPDDVGAFNVGFASIGVIPSEPADG